MDNLQTEVSKALRNAALNETAKHYLLQNPTLFNVLLKGAKRYIGGQNLEETISTVLRSNARKFPASIEFMGESVSSIAEANEVTKEFLKIIKAIKEQNLDSIVSLDLSHIGLAIDMQLAFDNLELLAKATKDSGIDVIISAEGIERTDAIINTFCKISPHYSNIGITLQAYLYRTPGDLDRILQETQGKIRMVKGAFAAPEEYAMARGAKLNDQYIALVERLFSNKRRCSIATHHDTIQERVKVLVNKFQVPTPQYEFEMLYGIRGDLLNNLQLEGHPCRQYIVYGKEWYLYVCNRIAENPDNLFQFIVDIVE